MKAITKHFSWSMILILFMGPVVHSGSAQQGDPLPDAPRSKTPPKKTTDVQPPSQTTDTEEKRDDDIVRITTNLVQMDVVVTDKTGHQVTDLTADDFEIKQEGHPQTITNFSYVSNTDAVPAGATNVVNESAAAVAPTTPRVDQPHRTIAIVVDDLMLSMETTYYARQAIRKFIDSNMGPNDRVAIFQTSLEVNGLNQFTSNREQLYATSARLRGKQRETMREKMERCAQFAGTFADLTPNDTPDEFADFRDVIRARGTLRSIELLMRQLRELPGRKAMVILSDGPFTCPNQPEPRFGYNDRFSIIADAANRASVVVYSIDPRGPIPLDSATDPGPRTLNPAARAAQSLGMSAAIANMQHAFDPLTDSTGGFSIRNNNDIAGALQRAVDDQSGYYLIGYRPGEETFDKQNGRFRFNNLKIKVKRSGLNVRTRSGFYGYADKRGPTRRTPGQPLGLDSTNDSQDIDVRLTSLFANEPAGSFMVSMLHINPAGLTFADEADGWHQAVMEVLAVTFDANGMVVDQVHKQQTIRARGNTYERILKNGIVYSLNVPVKKPGGYHLRIEVRDASSDRIGSASEFIDVPNLGNKHLTLSGIAVYPSTPPGSPGASSSASQSVPAPNEKRVYEPQPGPAYRRFHQNAVLEYDYMVYNAIATNGQTQLKTRVTISRGGKEILAGQEKDLDTTGQPDLTRLKSSGRLLLGESLPPGSYNLKVTVFDAQAGKDHNTATQSIDFEIVK